MSVPDIDIEPDMLPPTGRSVRELLSKDEPEKTARKPRQTKAEVKDSWDSLTEDLTSAYEFLGISLMFGGLRGGGQAMQQNAGQCAQSLVEQAKRSPRFHKWLTMVSTGGGWLGIAIAHAPVAMAIMGDLQGQNMMPPVADNMEEVFAQQMAANGSKSE